MKCRIGGVGYVVGLSVLTALVASGGIARATHDEPPRAKPLGASLVTAYEPCTQPNTFAPGGFPILGCAPPVRSDPVCGFGSSEGVPGKGRVKASAGPIGVELVITMSGLAIGCEGQRLCGVFDARVTSHYCSQQPCSSEDVELSNETAPACCTVSQGRCHLRSIVPTQGWGAFNGQRAGVELLACGMRRITGPSLPGTGHLTFACGLLAN